MAPNRRNIIDPAEREAVAETRRLYYEGLERGMSIADAVAYSKGQAKLAPAPTANEGSGAPVPPQSEADARGKQRAVAIPDDWESLPYVPREAGALSLRALASQVSSTPIANKKQAEKAVRDEIALRAKEDAEARTAVAIPDDWQSQPLADQIVLASQFTRDELKTEGDVERVIQIELARRAG